MDAICKYAEATPNRWCPNAYSRSINMVQANRISLTSNESKDITIITDEGDKVTLSYDHQVESTYAGLKALSYQGATATADGMEMIKETLTRMDAEHFQFENSQHMTISVDGDLNNQEMADIKMAIKQIDEIMTGLLHGENISEAAKNIEDLKHLESLSSFEADYSYERDVLLERYVAREVNTSSEYKSLERTGRGRHRIKHDALEKLIDKMANFLEDSKTKPHKFFRPLRKLFADISDRLDDQHLDHTVKKHIVGLIESALIEKVESMTLREQSEATFIVS